MPITREFFKQPLIIPCHLTSTELVPPHRFTKLADGNACETCSQPTHDDTTPQFVEKRETIYLTFRRETGEDATEAAIASIIGQQKAEIRFGRFCNLLLAVQGISDFPSDDQPIADRAHSYFNDPFWYALIRSVMLGYDRALIPG